MYKYFSPIGFFSIKKKEGEKINSKIFNNIPHLIKNCLRVYLLQGGFVMCDGKVIVLKIETIPPIPDSMIPVYLFKKHSPIINFTTDPMKSKFEFFLRKNVNTLYLT